MVAIFILKKINSRVTNISGGPYKHNIKRTLRTLRLRIKKYGLFKSCLMLGSNSQHSLSCSVSAQFSFNHCAIRTITLIVSLSKIYPLSTIFVHDFVILRYCYLPKLIRDGVILKNNCFLRYSHFVKEISKF